MKYNFAYPSERLSPFVKNFWSIENQLSKGESYAHRIIPSGLPELILYIDHKPQSTDRNIEDRLLLNGQQNNYYDLLISENLNVFSILFQPQGVNLFFDIPFSELANQSLPLKYLNKKLADELEGRLSECSSFDRRVQIAESILIRQLYDNHKLYDFDRIDHTINTIMHSKAYVEIDSLAYDSCLSRKQFERIFMKQIGMSPRQYLKIVRFQSALLYKSQHQNVSLTQLSHMCGYYDQSHFINDFKKFTGLTPKAFFDEDCDPISDLFQ